MDFFNLRLSLPAGWDVARTQCFAGQALEIVVAEVEGARILVFPPLPDESDTLVDALEGLIEAHCEGRVIVQRFPDSILGGATKGGLSFAAHHAISAGDDDDGVYAMYWALAAGGDVQAIVGVSGDADDYEELLPLLGTFVDRTTAI